MPRVGIELAAFGLLEKRLDLSPERCTVSSNPGVIEALHSDRYKMIFIAKTVKRSLEIFIFCQNDYNIYKLTIVFLVVKLSGECVEVVKGGKGRGNRERLDGQGSDVLHSGHQLVGEVGLNAVDAGHTETIVDAVDQTQTIVKAIDKASVLD